MNKVWIEIELDQNKAVNHERAEKFTNLITKLGVTKKVWFDETKYSFFSGDEYNGFKELGDKGDWFNLDFLGRED